MQEMDADHPGRQTVLFNQRHYKFYKFSVPESRDEIFFFSILRY